MRGWLLAALLAVGMVVGWWVVGAIDDGAIALSDVDGSGAFDYEFVIPAGTGERVDRGEEVGVVPRELVVHVGESIRIVNDDERGHAVGVFYVGAGETLTQRFDSPGVREARCDVHPSGRFTLRVDS